MTTTLVQQPTHQRAVESAKGCTLSDEARDLLGAEMSREDYYATLCQRKLFADALRFLAQALPKRVAVWWGCLCVWAVNREAPEEPFEAALQSAVRWVLDSSEENRRAAEKPGKDVGLGDPAGGLATAAFLSGGSMAPPELPAVPPPEHMTGKVVGGSVLLAAVKYDPSRVRENYRLFAALGAEVLKGQNLWPDKPSEDEPAPKAVSTPGATSRRR
jgi:hypothetical protein